MDLKKIMTLTNCCSKYFRNIYKICVTRNWDIRTFHDQTGKQVKVEQEIEVKWKNGKPFSSLPGPSKIQLIRSFLPGGKFHNKHFLDVNKAVFKEYGKILRFPSLFGKPTTVYVFDPKDIETVFRNEGQWPIRAGFETFEYYRKKVRPEVFKNIGGLINDQGEAWGKLRTTVNPIMMKPKVAQAYVPAIDDVAKDFIRKLIKLRDDKNEMPDDFKNELTQWSMEAVAFIAIEHRLGLLTNDNDPENQKLINALRDFFVLTFELDFKPSIWKYVKTPKFQKLMNAFDVMTDLSIKHIDRAVQQMENQTRNNPNYEESVLKKLLRIDKRYAVVMAVDMLLGGTDSTTSAVAGLLYNLAKNQRTQDKLREEIVNLLPNAEASLTPDCLHSLPYLRACLKESLRVTSVNFASLRCAGKDMVLQQYQIPKGTHCILGTITLQQSEQFVHRSSEFIPERFLKNIQPGCPNVKDIQPFILLPFGYGARSCVGRRFAETIIEVLIIRLLREYKIEWNYGPLQFANTLIVTPSSKLKYKISKL